MRRQVVEVRHPLGTVRAEGRHAAEQFNRIGAKHLPAHLGIVITHVGDGEVHAELEPVLKALGVRDFKPLMEQSVEKASAKAPDAQVLGAADAVLTALKIAAEYAPKSNAAPADVNRQVFADMLNRAAQQYSTAMRQAEGDAYLDGFGFAAVAKARAGDVLASLKKTAPETATKVAEALDLLGKAYASIDKPTSPPPVEPGELFVVVSKATFAMGGS